MDKYIYCIKEDYTISEVMEAIDRSNTRCVIVLNKMDKVVGVVSQGDVLRALISGANLYSHVSNIMNRSFIYLRKRDSEEAAKLMLQRRISLLPVLDEDYHLLDVVTVNDTYEYLAGKNND